MESVFAYLATQPVAGLFAVVALGLLLGQVSVRGISLGTSGVLFVALLFGHYKVRVPGAVTTLGVVLFVYGIGLQAGPRFFKTFRSRGVSFAVLAVVTLLSAFGAATAVPPLFGYPPALTTGLFTGALTTTPGLAAALEALGDAPEVSVGFGLAYPIGVGLVVLFVQLAPRLLGIDLQAEAARIGEATRAKGLVVAWFEVKNSQLDGRTVKEVEHAHLSKANLARIHKGTETLPCRHEVRIHLGDRLKAVGPEEELEKLEMLLGPRVDDVDEGASDITSRTLIVSEDAVAGKPLAELQIRERFGVVITRIFRDQLELVPNARTRLEIGDTIRVVGSAADCERLVPIVGHRERALEQTRFLPLFVGLLVGALIGAAPLALPGGMTLKLGMAGGPLFVGLLAGHFGRVGKLVFRTPTAARIAIQELGLILFLSGAGTKAGASFVEVLWEHGPLLFVASLLITAAPLVTAYLFARLILRLDVLSTLGAICGGMTSTPGLGAVSSAADSEVPALAYATVYPVALILVTVLAQLLATVLKVMAGA